MIWTALYTAWSWLPWLAGGSTTLLIILGIAAAAGLAPALSIVNKLLDMVQPLGVGASNLIVWLFQTLGKACKVAFANPSVFLLFLVFGFGGAVFLPEASPKMIKAKAQNEQCKKENAALRKSSRASPKKAPVQTRDDWSLPGWLQW
ncbi:hypothetical protein [Hyphomicrobium sp. DY-1]|uniref:hypothetical protein n=1 Tax=Hyphomicrobium sp. DY-1 TaxID=3075650 RepID=UPI0039C4537D